MEQHFPIIKKIEPFAGMAVIALIILGCFIILRPFLSAILWAGILCYSTWPLFIRLAHILRGQRHLAALLMTLIVTSVLIVPFVIVGIKMAENMSQAIDFIKTFMTSGSSEPPEWLQNLPLVGADITSTWQDYSKDPEKLVAVVKEFFTKSGGWLMRRSLDLGHGILQLTLSVFIAFFFYCSGEKVMSAFSGWGKRIVGDSAQHIFKIIGNTVNSVVYGLLGTALAQGIFAAIGFKIAGIPSALLLGLITFFLGFVPVGPPFIWVPATIWLFYTGHIGWGIFMGIWGFLIISGVDNVVRPYLISRGINLPFILILLGVLGGVLAFGFIGIFIGPSLLAVGYCLIREWSVSRKQPKPENPAETVN
ncbi:MAG: AI-2E family transporter [Kiritimatiellae bacterium]|nr:AI-2E family transporter [Kiritimatiellia bacterium]